MTFGQLPDGSRFWIGSQIYLKAVEEGGHLNAVNEKNSRQTIHVPEYFPVQRAKP